MILTVGRFERHPWQQTSLGKLGLPEYQVLVTCVEYNAENGYIRC